MGLPFGGVDAPRPSQRAKRFRWLLKQAALPGHFHLHCLRHSYASLLLQDGVSPAYVQEQLGHASIELTVGQYGRWLRKRAPGAVDRLDEPQNRADGEDVSKQVVANFEKVVANAPAQKNAIGASSCPRIICLW